MGSSPLTRGFVTLFTVCDNPARFIPAYAGVCSSTLSHHSKDSVHPRLRGGLQK